MGAAACFGLAYAVAQGCNFGLARTPFDYGTPYGTVYTVPGPTSGAGTAAGGTVSAAGGWTVVTVRDIFPDRYSFTAFVPAEPEPPTQSATPAQIRILSANTSATTLVRERVAANRSSRQGDVTFLIQRPATDTPPDQVNAPLDLSIVPGSVLFVRFQCEIAEASADVQASADAARTRCLTLSAKGQSAGEPPAGIVRSYVRELGVVAAQPSLSQRVAVMFLVGVGFTLLAWAIFSRRRYGGLKYLAIGKDNRYSNAQFQTVVWFFVLLVALTATQVFRVALGGFPLAGWIGIPAGLLALSGLSALTFVGAAIITDQNVKTASVVKPDADHPSFPHDLFHNDQGKFDLGDFQSAFISVLASLSYLVILLGYLGSLSLKRDALPDVESTILTIFGIAQGTYLVKKGLKISEQQDLAFSVTPETIKCAGSDPCTVKLIMAWTAPYQGRTLYLEALVDQQAYSDVVFPAMHITLNEPTRRQEIVIKVKNPGKGVTKTVTLRGVVDTLVRTANLTVEGSD